MTDQSGRINGTAKENKIVISDTDFLSSFLWRDQFGIVTKLFAKLGMDIVIPQAVIEELGYSIRTRERLQIPLIRLNNKKEKMRGAGDIYIRDIDPFSDMGIKYNELKESMGQGESAAISMLLYSEEKSACLASNNLKDISKYVEDYGITLWTTADVVVKAEELGIITHEYAINLWDKMLKDNLYLPENSYEEYSKRKKAVV